MSALFSVFSLVLLATVAEGQVPQASKPAPRPTTRARLGGPFGIGASIGVPTGVSGKLWFGDTSAIQFGFGGALGKFNDLALVLDYVVEFDPINVEGDDFSLPVHIGGGLKTDIDLAVPGGYLLVGPRLVLGISLLVPNLPIDFHVEIAPTAYVHEQAGWSMDGQIGARYYY